jgi:hypothetical protein
VGTGRGPRHDARRSRPWSLTSVLAAAGHAVSDRRIATTCPQDATSSQKRISLGCPSNGYLWLSGNEGLGRQHDADRIGVRDANRTMEVDHLPHRVLAAIDDRHPERALLLPDAEAHAVIDAQSTSPCW